MSQIDDFLFTSSEELIKAAEYHASTSPEIYQQSVRLYFIARYLAAMFESLVFKLPIQVWNEYRNALDHFMRYISHPNEETEPESQKNGGTPATCRFGHE